MNTTIKEYDIENIKEAHNFLITGHKLSGKTTICMKILRKLLKNNLSCLIFTKDQQCDEYNKYGDVYNNFNESKLSTFMTKCYDKRITTGDQVVGCVIIDDCYNYYDSEMLNNILTNGEMYGIICFIITQDINKFDKSKLHCFDTKICTTHSNNYYNIFFKLICSYDYYLELVKLYSEFYYCFVISNNKLSVISKI